jgi:Flp pilus assembly pilin Flp
MKTHRSFRTGKRQSGQGMTEYIIVVALVAVAAIGVYSFLGQTLRSQTAGIALELSGQNADAAISEARSSASSAQSAASQRKGLDSYGTSGR